LREICPRKKRTPKSGAASGTIAGVLLSAENVHKMTVSVEKPLYILGGLSKLVSLKKFIYKKKFDLTKFN
jgi:hypothetical protein